MANISFPHITELSLKKELIRNRTFFLKIDKTKRSRKSTNPINLEKEIDSIVQDGIQAFNSDSIDLILRKIKGNNVYSYKNLGTKLVDKLITRYLKDYFELATPSRNDMVDVLLSHLQEPSEYRIHRLDLKKFYESINTNELLHKLKTTDLQLQHINFIKNNILLKNGYGIKRGLPLSNVLSEICLKELDSIFQETEGIFFYKRFVDDIIIISDLKKKFEVKSDPNIKSFLTKFSLDFHSDKTKFLEEDVLSFDNKNSCSTATSIRKHIEFDLLGYHFRVANVIKNNSRAQNYFKKNGLRYLEIDLSDKTFNKIKRKLSASFSAYHKLPHYRSRITKFKLLDQRISFLTSNYRLFNQTKKVNFINGIYFGFRSVNKQKKLLELDKYLHYLIGREKRNTSSVAEKKKLDKLNRHSFQKGFEHKIFNHFSIHLLKEIRKCWSQI